VHEYGGGAVCVYNGVVYFSNFTDQVLYKQTSPTEKPVAVTKADIACRYADGHYSAQVRIKKNTHLNYKNTPKGVTKSGCLTQDSWLFKTGGCYMLVAAKAGSAVYVYVNVFAAHQLLGPD
jgi:hypothetical protein